MVDKILSVPESVKLLIDATGGNGLTFDEAMEFGNREDVRFGPGVPVIHVLANQQVLGRIEWHSQSKTFRRCEPRRIPNYDDILK